MPFRPISVSIFLMVHSFYEYIESNQSKTRDRKKRLQQEQTFVLQCFSLFLRSSVCSLLPDKARDASENSLKNIRFLEKKHQITLNTQNRAFSAISQYKHPQTEVKLG